MKLLTQELLDHFEEYSSEDLSTNTEFLARFYNPISGQFWLVNKYDKQTNTFFGLHVGLENQWGYFSVDKLENMKLPYGATIQRDELFDIRSTSLLMEHEAKVLGLSRKDRISQLKVNLDVSKDELER